MATVWISTFAAWFEEGNVSLSISSTRTFKNSWLTWPCL